MLSAYSTAPANLAEVMWRKKWNVHQQMHHTGTNIRVCLTGSERWSTENYAKDKHTSKLYIQKPINYLEFWNSGQNTGSSWLVGFRRINTFGDHLVFFLHKLNVKTVQVNVKTFLFLIIQFSISTQFQCISNDSVKHRYIFSMLKAVLFQTIHFSISTQFCSIWPIDKILSVLFYLTHR